MHIIACYSNKGGVGKTACSVNLAHGLAQQGRRVLLCDLDPQGASGFYFRVKPSDGIKLVQDEDRFVAAIRASDYENLDILPANSTFKDLDIHLSQLKNSQSRLKSTLKSVKKEYDVVILDCPPNISLLSENIFKAADWVVVPVIPTTLSERTLEQLYEFFAGMDFEKKKLLPFFSMVQQRKLMHVETMERLRGQYKHLLSTTIPFASDVEKMGVHRAPVSTYAGAGAAAQAFAELAEEIARRLS